MNESIFWVPVGTDRPDDEAEVLLALANGEVIPGYLDGADWRNYGAARLPQAPLFWAKFPVSPVNAVEEAA
jgi:hypothetical protein